MTKPAIVVSTSTLANPNGAGSDFALYSLDQSDGTLYGAGWLNGNIATPANPDGWGLDRIYVSSSPTLDDFSQPHWTGGQSPGTWNQSFTTLYDEVANPGAGTYSLVTYYGPDQALSGNLYYQVNDPTVVAEGTNLVMYMTAAPNRNEYPITDPIQPNGNPNDQIGWNAIGWALSSDGGATWTWEGTLPLTNADSTALLAPATLPFPTDPTVKYNLSAAGNEVPTAVFDPSTGLDLWYVNLGAAPEVWRSHADTSGNWGVAQQCRYITGAGSVNLYLVNPDVAAADDGSGTLWLVAQQWGSDESGDIKLFYSTTADGTNQGIDWHAWDGADGVLVVADQSAAAGLYDLVTPTILSVGNGSVSIGYSHPTTITPDGSPFNWEQITETLALPSVITSSLPVAFDGPSSIFFTGTSGEIDAWTTSNGTLGAASNIGTTGNWSLLASGNFAGPGSSGLLLANQSGYLADWIVGNGQANATYGIGTVGPGWQFLAPGDFNGDGTDDLLFGGPSGVLVDWTLKQGQLDSGGYIGTVGAGWNVIATGHFNGDATSDLLFSGAQGQIVDWIMSGNQVTASNFIGSVVNGWQFLATGDFNGDGTTDVLVNDAAGDVYDWIIKNSQAVALNYVGTVGSGWKLVATGDYNGDGTSDLLFSGPGGMLADWMMKNGQLSAANYVGSPDASWTPMTNVA
jgi:hypothetical protein